MAKKYLIAVVGEVETSTEPKHLRATTYTTDDDNRYFTEIEAESIQEVFNRHVIVSGHRRIKLDLDGERRITDGGDVKIDVPPIEVGPVIVKFHRMGEVADAEVYGIEITNRWFYVTDVAGRRSQVIHGLDVIEKGSYADTAPVVLLRKWMGSENEKRFGAENV